MGKGRGEAREGKVKYRGHDYGGIKNKRQTGFPDRILWWKRSLKKGSPLGCSEVKKKFFRRKTIRKIKKNEEKEDGKESMKNSVYFKTREH